MRSVAVGFSLLLSVLALPVQAGMGDVPSWLRGTHWAGSYTGGGQGETSMEIQVFNDAHFILRFYSRYGQKRFDGFYGGYINYDPVSGRLRFNPETDISWFTRPSDDRNWKVINLETWNIPWDQISGYPAFQDRIMGVIEGGAVAYGDFHLKRVRQ